MDEKQINSGWVCLEEQTVRKPQKKKKYKYIYKPKKKHTAKKRHVLRGFLFTVSAFAVIYSILVFSHIPFIEKWRTIYIETAMGTMSHQWLATLFLPQPVIDDVMNARTRVTLEQESYNSDWDEKDFSSENVQAIGTWEQIQDTFSQAYPEIDQQSFQQYMNEHGLDEILDEDGYLLIDQADYDADKTGITTVHGDPVYAVDTRNGIVIVGLEGDGYAGRMAIVKNPEQVKLAVSDTIGDSGSYLDEICEDNHAVLGINASGFSDPGGTGNGGEAFGMILAGSQSYSELLDPTMKVIGIDQSNHLTISNKLLKNTRDAMQFSPALVVNGTQIISGSSGWGLQPRSVIAQAESGEIFLTIVDGRQPGYSIGITVGELADILYQYGAYQACNLDGGSSAIMYYRGRNITHSSAVTPDKGRHIPNAWIVAEN